MALTRRDLIATSFVAFISWVAAASWFSSLRLTPYAFGAGVFSALVLLLAVFLLTANDVSNGGVEKFPDSSFLHVSSAPDWASETTYLKEQAGYQRPELAQNIVISKHIGLILDLILRDFVKSWYQRIGPSTAFTNSVDLALSESLKTIESKLLETDLVEVGVTRLLPIITNHVKDFNEAESQVRGRKLNRDVTESEELDVAIAARYRNEKLHPAVSLTASSPTTAQVQHLRRLVGRLLPEVLSANMLTSSSVLVLVRETVSNVVLLPLMQLLTDPDVLNQLIEAYGRSVLLERKTVQKLRAALDEHASPKSSKAGSTQIIPRLRPEDDERAFERFIRAIRLCNSVTDARRFRKEIQIQIRRGTIAQGSDAVYARRLETGAKLLDQRIDQLTASIRNKPNTAAPVANLAATGAFQRKNATLREVLYDSSGLSYFMEFMDRIHLMKIVQFWVVVDGVRGPLDVDGGYQDSSSQMTDESSRQDLSQVADLYVDVPELKIPDPSKDLVREFLKAGRKATATQYSKARAVLLTTQDQIYEDMTENNFPKFKQSDLYFKWLSSDVPALPSPTPLLNEDLSQSTESLPDKKSVGGRLKKEPELRRSAMSSSDLVFAAKEALGGSNARLSLDDPRPPLFGDEDDEDGDPMAQSTTSLNFHAGHSHSLSTPVEEEQHKMEAAVQAALENIIDEEPEKEPLSRIFSSDIQATALDPQSSVEGLQTPGDNLKGVVTLADRSRPTLNSLGLLGTPARRTVFNSDDLFGENEKLWEEDNEQGDNQRAKGASKTDEDEIHEAAPGDLGLTEVIQSLNLDIEKLEAQQTVVESLTQKAELTNNVAELRILRKSKESLDKEIRRKELQRQQYIVQESDNSLYGRASITIKSIMVGTQNDGHEFALYVIEVQREAAGEKGNFTSWAVARRYSEFHELHKRLRSKFPFVKSLDFPGRQMVLTLQKDFLKKRQVALEKYLQTLLADSVICRSLEFRAFLSQQAIRPISGTTIDGKMTRQDFVTRIYNSVTDGMEEFLGNIPVLDQLSAAGQNLISAASGYAQLNAQQLSASVATSPVEAAEGEAEITAFETSRNPEVVSFIRPICDAFLEIFQLNQSNNWLRGRALVAVIQQLLGGTIERRVRDSFKTLTSEDQLAQYLDWLQETLWPDGVFRSSPPARTAAEKTLSQREATLILAALLPDLAGGVVGKGNAAKAGRRIFATLNNAHLNQHLMYTLLDEVVDVLFGVRVTR